MYDLILRDARIIDGKSTDSFNGDIAVSDGIIQEIAPKINAPAARELFLNGNIAAPGFIDIHTHSELVPFNRQTRPRSKLFQGVTTEIVGNCGISSFPLNDMLYQQICDFYYAMVPNSAEPIPLTDYNTEQYAAHIRRSAPCINYGVLIGHGTLRGSVMGFGMEPPTKEQLHQMEEVLDRELSMGAFGMSLGLIYPPSSFSHQEELVALAKVLWHHDAILAVHMRNEGPRVFQAADEMLNIARLSGVRLQISHLKLMGKQQWGRSSELLEKIERARQDGLQVTCDQYPYPASSTGLSALVPGWALDGGVHALIQRLQPPSRQLLDGIEAEMERRGGADCVMIVSTHGVRRDVEGKTLAQLAAEYQTTAPQQAARLLSECSGAVNCIYFSMDQKDVNTIMRDLNIAVASDGCSYDYDEQTRSNRLHPRSFGTFPRFFQTVREQQLLTPEQAVYKATGLPAKILGLSDRGVLEVGKVADLTIFNWNEIVDCCTYLDPVIQPKGILHVLVGGVPVLENGAETGNRPGSVLLH